MYLNIFKKGDFLYSQVTEEPSTRFFCITEKMKRQELRAKHKIAQFEINSFADINRQRDELMKYKFMAVVAKISYPDKVDIIARLDILNNPFYTSLLESREEIHPVIEKDNTEIMVAYNLEDWKEIEEKFNFQSDFGGRIFDTMQ